MSLNRLNFYQTATIQKIVNYFCRDHYSLHSDAGFEGFYTRIQTEDGSTFAIIFCWVNTAKHRKNLVHVSYNPSKSGKYHYFKTELFPDFMRKESFVTETSLVQPFTLTVPTVGSYEVTPEKQTYNVSFKDELSQILHLNVELTHRTPWDHRGKQDSVKGPESYLVHLNKLLPLHWFVFSTKSTAKYSLQKENSDGSLETVLNGTGVAHQEKNWGISFPDGWIWSQGFSSDHSTYFSIAGGRTLGIHAYLIGFRSPKINWDFRPPFTVALPNGRGLFIDETRDSKLGVLKMTVSDFTRKLEFEMKTSKDTYMKLACPLKDGHEPDFAVESFRTSVKITAYEKKSAFNGKWNYLEAFELEEAALEFGGKFYDKTMFSSEENV